MLVVGAIPFSSFKEKRHLSDELRRKFQDMKLKLDYEEGLIIYRYFEPVVT